MTVINRWRNSLIVSAAAAICTTTPSFAGEVNTATASFNTSPDAVEITVPPPETGNNGLCSFFAEPAINAIIYDPSYKGAKWGILVETLEGKALYRYNADNYLIPASNVKLLTTAAALQRLSPNASIRSHSLKDWITTTNLRSDNGYAETLLSFIGGATAAKQALARIGIDPNSYRMADGSGLSRSNAATPRALVNTLRAMYHAQGREVFLASLPVAGISGTLKNRMRQTPAQGMVYAKTGTLRGVRALSGYMNHPQYGTVLFSIMVNHPSQSGQQLVQAIDSVVLRLSMLTPCE